MLYPADPHGVKVFGFSEFLTGLALMVLAWSIADVRYRFRLYTASIPLQHITFTSVLALGILTLSTDVWRAQGWSVPVGNLLTPVTWQALLASLFLVTFLTWAWLAFIRPPKFGKWNAERYVRTLYRFIIKGDPTELSVIADELTKSAKALMTYASDRNLDHAQTIEAEDNGQGANHIKVEVHANDLLLLIADRRFCRVIIGSSPLIALLIFQEIRETKKYGVPVEIFAKNIVNEALNNKDSFLYHETNSYQSGLIGHYKPLSQAMFANFRMVEVIGTMLDPYVESLSKWDSTQWDAYCRAVLITFRDYVENDFFDHSYTLYRAKGYIERAAFDLYKLNGVVGVEWDSDIRARLRVIINFTKDAVTILNKKGMPNGLKLRIRKGVPPICESFYDHLATLIFETIFAASAVQSPSNLCWEIQHNEVWGALFNFHHLDTPAGRVVKFKVRRLIYNEISAMGEFPNFKGAKILGFCLNVMGLRSMDRKSFGDSLALHKAILAWTKKHFDWLL